VHSPIRVTFVDAPVWRYADADVAGQTARTLARSSFSTLQPERDAARTPPHDDVHLVVDERVWCHPDVLASLVTSVREAGTGVRVVNTTGQILLTVSASDDVVERTVADIDRNERLVLLDSPAALAACERHVLFSRAVGLLMAGVRVRDPYALYLRGSLQAGEDVDIDIGTIVEGDVVLADCVQVGAHCLLRDCRIGPGTVINAYSIVDGADVGAGCRVGPYGRLRPGARLGSQVQIGNFVEVKASQIGDGCRINHHSFIGDATLGARVTIGAGSITCNHDGTGTQPTVIGADVTVGSGCQLVAPVTIAAGATVGAGSTITENVPGEGLTLARARQATIHGWNAPRSRRPHS